MTFRLVRSIRTSTPDGTIAVMGRLIEVDNPHGYDAYTLERQAVIIPAATYDLAFTKSERARLGQLWTPFNDTHSLLHYLDHLRDCLPEILHVPGRAGVRVHAFNEAPQSQGCVGVGKSHGSTSIAQSKLSLEEFCRALVQLERDGVPVKLEVIEAFAAVPTLP